MNKKCSNDGSGNLAADSGLFWDNTSKQLHLGDGTLSSGLAVSGRNWFREDNAGQGIIVARSSDHRTKLARLGFQKSRGTENAPTAVIDGDEIGSIEFQGYKGTEYTTYGARSGAAIKAWVNGTVTESSLPTALSFHTTDEGAATNTESMRITAAGHVSIGTLAPSTMLEVAGTGTFYSLVAGNTDNVSKLTIIGYGGTRGYAITYRLSLDVSAHPANFLNMSGVPVGAISTNATTTTYNTTSDYRLKENIVPITNALQRISALIPRHYNFKTTPDKIMDGFIAHEVQAVAPYAVSGEKDAVDEDGEPIYQQVDCGKLTPLLVAAVQEFKAANDKLQSIVEGQQREIEALKPAR